MIVLVGGNGFIGRHLQQALEMAGESFTVVGRSSVQSQTPYLTVEEFAGEDGDSLLEQCTSLVWLAGSASPISNLDSLQREIDQTVAPAIKTFDRLLDRNWNGKVVFLSSGGQVYGSGWSQPIPESATTRPVSPYGMGKLMVEQALAYLGRTRGLRHVVLRVANPVGIWQRHKKGQGLVCAVLDAVKEGRSMKVFGDGGVVRDYFDCDDLADAIVRAIKYEGALECFNIGSGKPRSIVEVIRLIEEQVGQSVRIERMQDRPVDVPYAVLECQLARRHLDWEASVSMRETVRKLLQNGRAQKGF